MRSFLDGGVGSDTLSRAMVSKVMAPLKAAASRYKGELRRIHFGSGGVQAETIGLCPAVFQWADSEGGGTLLVYGGVNLACNFRQSEGAGGHGCGGGDGGDGGRWCLSSLVGRAAQTYSNATGSSLSFGELRELNPGLARKFQYRGGYRSAAEAGQLYVKVPGSVRTTVDGIVDFLAKRDASHIQAKAHGGSNNAGNIVWESSQVNRQRNYDFRAGRRDTPHMTEAELQAVRAEDKSLNRTSGGITIAGAGRAAGIGAVLDGVLSAVENADAYKRGEISGLTYAGNVAADTARGAAYGALGYVATAAAVAAAPAVAIPAATALAAYGVYQYGTRLYEGLKKLSKD